MAGKIYRKIFTDNGTWIAPAGVSNINIIGCGGGGGGGGGTAGTTAAGTPFAANAGAGGAGSPYGIYKVTVVPGDSYAVTVGSGGAGGVAGTGTLAGGNGVFGGSSFVVGVFLAQNGSPESNNTMLFKGGSGASSTINGTTFGYTGSRGGLPIRDLTREHTLVHGSDYINSAFIDQQPGAGGNGTFTNPDFVQLSGRDGIGTARATGGGGGTTGTNDGVAFGGGRGGGGGASSFPYFIGNGANGGDGGNGSATGTAGNGTAGSTATGVGAGGGGGGGGGSTSSGTPGNGGAGGIGSQGIIIIEWVA